MAKTFTREELARFDGRAGRPGYVAVDGKVYDITKSRLWPQGRHLPCDLTASAGRDLSEEINAAPSFMRSRLAEMPLVGELGSGAGGGRRLAQAGLVALFVVVLAIPVIALATSGIRTMPAAWIVLRIAALEALTLLFADVVTGAFRPRFARVFRATRLQGFHKWLGIVAFALAAAHAATVIALGLLFVVRSTVWIGPVVLGVLFVVIVTALSRRWLRSSWRWIHRVNYVLFALSLIKGLTLGYNLRTQLFLRIIFYIYAAVVVAGLAYRINDLLGRRGIGTEPAGTLPAGSRGTSSRLG